MNLTDDNNHVSTTEFQQNWNPPNWSFCWRNIWVVPKEKKSVSKKTILKYYHKVDKLNFDWICMAYKKLLWVRSLKIVSRWAQIKCPLLHGNIQKEIGTGAEKNIYYDFMRFGDSSTVYALATSWISKYPSIEST